MVKLFLKYVNLFVGSAFLVYFILLALGYPELADRVGWRLLAPIPLWYLLAVLGGMIVEITLAKK